MNNKTGTIYRSSTDMPSPILPTKTGYEQFTIYPVNLNLDWVAVNNYVGKEPTHGKTNISIPKSQK